MQGAFIEVPLHREFAQPDAHERLPDESTILGLGKTPSPRHRPERHTLAQQVLARGPGVHSSQRKALDKQNNCLNALIDLLEKTKGAAQ